jgi:hypothetical protein
MLIVRKEIDIFAGNGETIDIYFNAGNGTFVTPLK